MSQLVRSRGKHTAQTAHCALEKTYNMMTFGLNFDNFRQILQFLTNLSWTFTRLEFLLFGVENLHILCFDLLRRRNNTHIPVKGSYPRCVWSSWSSWIFWYWTNLPPMKMTVMNKGTYVKRMIRFANESITPGFWKGMNQFGFGLVL